MSLASCDTSNNNTTITNPGNGNTNQNDETPQNNGQNNNEEKEYDNISVKVTNKTNLPVDYDQNRYSQRGEFSFLISNKTSKSIKGIKGILTIKDLFGAKIISLNCDFTGKTVNANSKATFDGIGFDINQFIDHHVKVYNEDFEDLIFEHKVTKIVYSDGTQE